MAITVTLGGVDVTAYVRIETLEWSDRLNSRASASFTLIDPGAGWLLTTEDGDYITTEDGDYITLGELTYAIGSAVTVADGAVTIFGGTIESFTLEKVKESNNNGAVAIAVQCVSYDAIADKRLIAASYATGGQTLRDVVLLIVADALTSEGIDTTNVATGPVIDPVQWNYERVSKAFNDLSDLTGYHWWISPTKQLYFQPRTGTAAAFSVSESSSNARNVRVEETRGDYRNKQYVKAGMGLTASRTENFVGDGTRKSFTLAFPAGTEPAITVAAVSKTVGIRGVESGHDWYWNKGDPIINQDDGAAAVAAATAIAATYQGLYPILVQSQLDAEITTRASAESGSGVYEEIVDAPNLDDEDSALGFGNGLLRRYGRIPRTVEFETDTSGLLAGRLLPIDFPTLGLDGDWLIESVSVVDVKGSFLRYRVKALDGESLGGWINFFAALVNSARKFVIRDNEVILLLRRFEETVTVTDTMTFVTAAPSAPLVDTAVVGFCDLTS